MTSFDPSLFLAHHPIDVLIGIVSLSIFAIAGVDRLKRFIFLLHVMLLLLRFYKHIAPMAQHYFKTHPTGQGLRRKTKIDNRIDYLIKEHKLPYDKEAEQKKLEAQRAAG